MPVKINYPKDKEEEVALGRPLTEIESSNKFKIACSNLGDTLEILAEIGTPTYVVYAAMEWVTEETKRSILAQGIPIKELDDIKMWVKNHIDKLEREQGKLI